jgi:hypothetical protein
VRLTIALLTVHEEIVVDEVASSAFVILRDEDSGEVAHLIINLLDTTGIDQQLIISGIRGCTLHGICGRLAGCSQVAISSSGCGRGLTSCGSRDLICSLCLNLEGIGSGLPRKGGFCLGCTVALHQYGYAKAIFLTIYSAVG